MGNKKAERIRKTLEELGWEVPPKKVIARLKEDGVTVTSQQVCNEKAKWGRVSPSINLDDLPVSILKKVKALVDEIGSIAMVRRALDELEKLNVNFPGPPETKSTVTDSPTET